MTLRWKNDAGGYGAGAKSFHWVSALLVLLLLPMGFFMAWLAFSPLKLDIYWWHKSLGTLVFFLVLLRLLWRLLNKEPDHIQTHRQWERILAKTVHVLLYTGMIAMPLSGLIMSGASDFPRPFFNLFDMPDVVPGKNEALAKAMRQTHEIGAWALILAVALHSAGAFKHHFIDKDATFKRMAPGFTPNVMAFVFAVLTLFTLGKALEFALKPQQNREEATAITAAAAASAPQTAAAETTAPRWNIIADQSAVGFTAQVQGAPFTGKFTAFSGEIFFDPENLAQSRADIRVDIASVASGSPERDQYIVMPPWLNAGLFPQAHLVTTGFEKHSERAYTATADLTLRDITHPVRIPFTLDIATDSQGQRIAVMEGSFTINRLDFGIGAGEWADPATVGETVAISVLLRTAAE